MASPFTTRQAGLASITAAALILVSQVSQLALPLFVTESFWIATQSLRMGLAMVAMFALLIVLTALYARQAPEIGNFGLAGYLTAFLGTLLVAGNWWYEAFIGPVLRQQAPELLATAPSGSILFAAIFTGVVFALGWTLLGLASIRAGIVPRGAAVLMTIGGVVGVLTLISPFQLPLALAVGWVGLWLIRSDARARQSTRSRVPAVA